MTNIAKEIFLQTPFPKTFFDAKLRENVEILNWMELNWMKPELEKMNDFFSHILNGSYINRKTRKHFRTLIRQLLSGSIHLSTPGRKSDAGKRTGNEHRTRGVWASTPANSQWLIALQVSDLQKKKRNTLNCQAVDCKKMKQQRALHSCSDFQRQSLAGKTSHRGEQFSSPANQPMKQT